MYTTLDKLPLGEPITYKSVGEFVGLPAINLKAYPQVVALIRQHRNFRDFQKNQHLRREEELLSQVQGVVQQMRNRGLAITRTAIAREVGLHLVTLQRYGQIKDFLDQEVDVPIDARKQVVQSRQRESKILKQVENAVQQLEEKEQKISRKIISNAVGVSVRTLTSFPRVRLLLEEKVNYYEQRYMQSKEDELLEQVEEAIETMHAAGQRVTQETLARAVGVTRTTFKQYPRVVHLLEENTKMQAQLHENDMMLKVKEAIQILEESGYEITHKSISEQLNMDHSNLHHYPSVIAFVQKTCKEKQKQYREKQFSLEEERLIHSMLDAIRQLQSQRRPISLTAVARMLHIDTRKLKRFPKIQLILNEVCSFRNQK